MPLLFLLSYYTPWERLHPSLPRFMSLPLNSSWQKVHNWLTVLTVHSIQETTTGHSLDDWCFSCRCPLFHSLKWLFHTFPSFLQTLSQMMMLPHTSLIIQKQAGTRHPHLPTTKSTNPRCRYLSRTYLNCASSRVSREMPLSQRTNGGPCEICCFLCPYGLFKDRPAIVPRFTEAFRVFTAHSACARHCTKQHQDSCCRSLCRPSCFLSFRAPIHGQLFDHFGPEQGCQCVIVFQHKNTPKVVSLHSWWRWLFMARINQYFLAANFTFRLYGAHCLISRVHQHFPSCQTLS